MVNSNIYFNKRNIFFQNGHAKLGDLGCAKNIQASKAKTFIGTFCYMSPEMIQSDGNDVDYKTDVW